MELIEALVDALGASAVLTGDGIPPANTHDWSTLAPVPPRALLRPADTDGVARAMRVCAAHGVAVVPQGGLTGLCGGARPSEGAVALSLDRLTGIEEIDAASMTMTVRAGTPLETLQNAADDAGFLLPLDLGARGSCQIGGNIATNAGGNRVIRYGMTRDLVLGLEIVLPDGGVITALNKMIKNNAGYDLRQFFIGSEGTLGVVTRAVLRLHPKPASVSAAICGLASYDDVVRFLAAARRGLGPLLSAFEVMWSDYWEIVTAAIPAARDPLAGHHAFHVLIEQHGMDADHDADRFTDWLGEQLEAGIIEDAAVARSVADVRAFWAVRDAVSEFRQVVGPYESFDVGLAVGDMDRAVGACRLRMAALAPDARAVFYGHIADGNLHAMAWQPGASVPPKAEIEAAVYETVREFGGTVSAEHGIGSSKRKWLPYARSDAERALMRRIKDALDPAGLLNPGKVV